MITGGTGSFGNRVDRCEDRSIEYRSFFPPHGEHRTCVATGQNVVEGYEAELAWVGRHAGDDHSFRFEQGS